MLTECKFSEAIGKTIAGVAYDNIAIVTFTDGTFAVIESYDSAVQDGEYSDWYEFDPAAVRAGVMTVEEACQRIEARVQNALARDKERRRKRYEELRNEFEDRAAP